MERDAFCYIDLHVYIYVPEFGLLGAMIGLQVIWSLMENLIGLIGFLDPENHDVDTNITAIRCIIKELW